MSETEQTSTIEDRVGKPKFNLIFGIVVMVLIIGIIIFEAFRNDCCWGLAFVSWMFSTSCGSLSFIIGMVNCIYQRPKKSAIWIISFTIYFAIGALVIYNGIVNA